MSAIRILPDRVANQIAAGEVIERPVAVVKELVENSLDAGAAQVEVEFRNGGKSYLRISDDGSGMRGDEAMLALERHATSKLRVWEDLQTVRSFGFRGEALPSIASVSRFQLQTRVREAAEGTEILVNAGKLIHRRACGMAAGTRIEVSQLFHAVPGRRKFLKTDNTEAAHIVQLMRLLAVAHPEVGFRLLEDGRLLFQSPACADLRERVAEIWNRQLARDLAPIEAERDGIRVHGLVGHPGVARATRQELITLVNRRPVDSRTLSYAVIEAFHGLIPKGRYPVAFLFLETDPAGVDVNVHPAKREVRFREEAKVRNVVLTALLERLRELQKAGRSGAQVSQRASEQSAAGDPVGKQAGSDREASEGSGAAGKPGPAGLSPASARTHSPPRPSLVLRPSQPGARPTDRQPGTLPEVSSADASAQSAGAAARREGRSAPEASSRGQTAAERAGKTPQSASNSQEWRYIGRFDENYGLFQAPEGLVLLNEHSARDRIRFEAICRQLQEDHDRAVQRLLFPVSLELTPLAAQAFEELFDALRRWGFEVEPFGRNFYRATALPDWLLPEDAADFLRDLAALARERGREMAQPHLAREAVARLALKQGEGHTTAYGESLASLAAELLRCEQPLTDPNGRPTFIQLDRAELRRRFGR